ncbi:hypothetical protein, partial [Streptomyces spiralis]
RSRTFAVGAAKRLIPGSRGELAAMMAGIRLFGYLPTPIARVVSKLGGGGLRLHDDVTVAEYAPARRESQL